MALYTTYMDDDFNITTGERETFEFEFSLTENGEPIVFAPEDKIVVKISQNGVTEYEKVFDIEDSAFLWHMDYNDAVKIPPLWHSWGFCIAYGATVEDGKIVDCENYTLPIIRAKYYVERAA
jgi:hypothetical protein